MNALLPGESNPLHYTLHCFPHTGPNPNPNEVLLNKIKWTLLKNASDLCGRSYTGMDWVTC